MSWTADVVVVGGGIIGAACADALAERDLRVVLIERDHLAAGASGRNQGLFVTPSDPALVPMTLASLERYLAVADEAPLPVRFDRDPIGFIRVAEAEEELAELEAVAVAAEASGTAVDRLGPSELRELEPALAPNLLGGHLLHTGRRLDPTSLTVSLALRARSNGCEVREHLGARSLLVEDHAVRGVVTDEGPLRAETVVLAAGPWSQELLRPLGIRLAVTAARGWLVLVDAGRSLVSRPLESGGGQWQTSSEATTAGEFVADPAAPKIGTLINPADDGSLALGSSIEHAFSDEPNDPGVPRAIVRRAIRFVPALADARLVSTWWGVRPMTPDDRPIVGRVRHGLVLATGHGAEGVILGAGTGVLVRSIVTGEAMPFDASPFDPTRFS